MDRVENRPFAAALLARIVLVLFLPRMATYTTLADLWRAKAQLMVQCGGCQRYSKLHLAQISMPERVDIMPDVYETIIISDVVLKLKCRECGGRVNNWQAVFGVHGGMATG